MALVYDYVAIQGCIGHSLKHHARIAVCALNVANIVLAQDGAILLHHLPHVGAFLAIEAHATARTTRMSVLFPGKDILIADNLLPLVDIKSHFAVDVHTRACDGVLPISLQARSGVLNGVSVTLVLQELGDPGIEIVHLDALHLVCRANLTQVLLDIGRKVLGEGSKEHALAWVGELGGKTMSAVHGHDRLARAGAAQNTRRT